ncbi:MAG: lactate utilization protein [Deltaproteobacteria bacterium]
METENYHAWLWEKRAETCVENLKKHDFDAQWVPGIQEAKDLILGKISAYHTFGFAGSETTRVLGVIAPLMEQGKTIYDHWQEGLFMEQDLDIRLNQGRCDCFLCSANAVSMTGELVNVDGVGNRTSAMAFGPKHVVVVAGMNKVTQDLDSALQRIKDIAGPMRAKSLNMDTPCAKTGRCSDCNSPQRICRITTILHRKPMMTEVSVVLINEALGF